MSTASPDSITNQPVSSQPLSSLEQWDDFVAARYREGKSEEEFRQYDKAAQPAVARIEERLVGVGHDARVGEGRGVEGDQLQLGLSQSMRPEPGRKRRGGRLAGRLLLLGLCLGLVRACAGLGRHKQGPQEERTPFHASAGRAT